MFKKPNIIEPLKPLSFPALGGGTLTVGGPSDRWTMLFEAKAKADKEEFGWTFDLGYGLTETQMRTLGLYVSAPLSESETDHNFAEPGAFGIRPDGTLMLVNISNGPAARPDLDELLDGMKFNITNNRPTRGTS